MTATERVCHKLNPYPRGGVEAPCGEPEPTWLHEDWEVVTCPKCLALHNIEQGNVSVVKDPNFDDGEFCEENTLHVEIEFAAPPEAGDPHTIARMIYGMFEDSRFETPGKDYAVIRVQVSEKP